MEAIHYLGLVYSEMVNNDVIDLYAPTHNVDFPGTMTYHRCSVDNYDVKMYNGLYGRIIQVLTLPEGAPQESDLLLNDVNSGQVILPLKLFK